MFCRRACYVLGDACRHTPHAESAILQKHLSHGRFGFDWQVCGGLPELLLVRSVTYLNFAFGGADNHSGQVIVVHTAVYATSKLWNSAIVDSGHPRTEDVQVVVQVWYEKA